MRKLRNTCPSRQLGVGVPVLRRYQLDSSLRPARALGKKNRAVIRPAQPLPQRELLIDNSAPPILPEFRRSVHDPRHGEALFYSTPSPGAQRTLVEKQLCQDRVLQDRWEDLAAKRGNNTACGQELARKQKI